MAANNKSSYWSLTINNPTPADEENIAQARQKGWKVEGQREIGENGTPHYQLLLHTGQVRFSAVKKMFPRAHIEPARNPVALQQYVHKEDTRDGELKVDNEMYPSLSKFWALMFDYFNVHEKYGLHQDKLQDGIFELYDGRDISDPKIRLSMLDEAASHLIRRGYHVEGIAVNPSTRSSVARFLPSIFERCQKQFKDNNANAENAPEVLSSETHHQA